MWIPEKIKMTNEKGATILNLVRIIKLLAGELTFDALNALLRLTKDSFIARGYKRVVSTTKETTEAQSRWEAAESSSNAIAAQANKSHNPWPEGKIVRDVEE